MEQDRAPPVSFITQNWRAKPLLSYRVIVELIGATTTKTGLTVRCELDDKSYPNEIIVSDDEMRSLNIQHADFHGEWNYTIGPRTSKRLIPDRPYAAVFDGIIEEEKELSALYEPLKAQLEAEEAALGRAFRHSADQSRPRTARR